MLNYSKLEGPGDCFGGRRRLGSTEVGLIGDWMDWRLDESAIGVAYGLDERVMVETDGYVIKELARFYMWEDDLRLDRRGE